MKREECGGRFGGDRQNANGTVGEAGESLARRDGFTGKLAIHPDQVPIINTVFTPSPAAIARATAVAEAFAAAGGAGSIAFEGQMLDRPHLRQAESLLARAKAAGLK